MSQRGDDGDGNCIAASVIWFASHPDTFTVTHIWVRVHFLRKQCCVHRPGQSRLSAQLALSVIACICNICNGSRAAIKNRFATYKYSPEYECVCLYVRECVAHASKTKPQINKQSNLHQLHLRQLPCLATICHWLPIAFLPCVFSVAYFAAAAREALSCVLRGLPVLPSIMQQLKNYDVYSNFLFRLCRDFRKGCPCWLWVLLLLLPPPPKQ